MKPYNPLLHMICTPNTGHPVLGVHIMQHVALYGLYSFVRFVQFCTVLEECRHCTLFVLLPKTHFLELQC